MDHRWEETTIDVSKCEGDPDLALIPNPNLNRLRSKCDLTLTPYLLREIATDQGQQQALISKIRISDRLK